MIKCEKNMAYRLNLLCIKLGLKFNGININATGEYEIATLNFFQEPQEFLKNFLIF